MGISLPGHLSPMLGLMGVSFPTTDEDSLTSDAAQWRSFASTCRSAHGDLRAAVDYLKSANTGPTANAFASYRSGKSNLTGTEAMGEAADRVAEGCVKAAQHLRTLKVAIIAEASSLYRLYQLTKGPFGQLFEDLFNEAVGKHAARCRQLDAKTAAVIQG